MLETHKTAQVRRRYGCLLFYTLTTYCIRLFNNNCQIYPILIFWFSGSGMHNNSISNAKCPLKSKYLRCFFFFFFFGGGGGLTVDPT